MRFNSCCKAALLLLALCCLLAQSAYAHIQSPGDEIQVSVSVTEGPVCVGTAVTFSASATDTDTYNGESKGDRIKSYKWTLSDGSTAEGASVTRTFTTPGTYNATVTVDDWADFYDDKAVDKTTANVIVFDLISMSGGGGEVHWKTDVTFTAVTDPGGTGGDKLTWSGGGTPGGGTGLTFTTQWDSGGTKTVKVSACNKTFEAKVVVLIPCDGSCCCCDGTPGCDACNPPDNPCCWFNPEVGNPCKSECPNGCKCIF